jgi:glycosyltransferase involved in cell wall biosynthesis
VIPSPQAASAGSSIDLHSAKIAVLIPCRNEEAAIGTVVADFRAALPMADIYVYDNNSTDRTIEVARAAGAKVYREQLQGKGNVIRRMFSDVEADLYVLVDGDDTYDASVAPAMLMLLVTERLDMVNGARVAQTRATHRRGHRFGNTALSGLVAKIFGARVRDMLSGYRVFSRRFVKSFPASSAGFETETELTIHALELRMPVSEVETEYRDRPAGSSSKLRTYSDGLRILRTIVMLVKDERPLLFFAIAGLVLLIVGVGISVPVFVEFHRTHLVPRFPTAILSVGIVLSSFLSVACGLILDSVARGRAENKRMRYMSISLWPYE